MRIFGLIGYPLSHSFSKKFFTEKFSREGLAECSYENFPIASVDELGRVLSTPGLEGLNITIPYKEKVIPFLDYLSGTVKETGACNCIRVQDNKYYGYNTDVTGFELSLKRQWKPRHRKALVLGTGGAAKAIWFVLEKMGIEYLSVSRTAGKDRVTYEQLTPAILKEYLLIINTTPLGMYPKVEEYPPLDYNAITGNHFLFDIIYNPEQTEFLKKGAARGAAVQNGQEMLEIQAEESWKIWNNLA